MQSHDYSPSGRLLGGWNAGIASPDYQRIPVPFLPVGIAVDTQRGLVYVADSFNSCVRTFTLALEPLARFGRYGEDAGQFVGPCGIAVDVHGMVYVADTCNHRIQKLSPDGAPLAQWGSWGRDPGQFILPCGLAVDAHSNIYVTDTNNDRIQKFSPTGEPLAQWGTHGRKPGQFYWPAGIAVGQDGTVYVADSYNDRIQKFSPDGAVLAQVGKKGDKPGQVRSPRGLAVDHQGTLYVAEWSNHRIQTFAPDGKPVACWGERGSRIGQCREPCDVAVDDNGVLYVADSGNERVLKISPTGDVLSTFSLPDEEAAARHQHELAAAADAEQIAERQRARRTYAVPPTVVAALKDLIHQLVLGNVETLAHDGRAGDRTAEELRRVITDYGGTLVDPPEEAFEAVTTGSAVSTNLITATTFETNGDNPVWPITLALWTREEGRSGLRLEVAIHPEPHPLPAVIRDLVGFPPQLIPAIKEVVHHLVEGQYEELVATGRAPGWTAASLEEAIREYQEAEADDDDPQVIAQNRLIELPEEAFISGRAYGITGDATGWNVDVDLWMAQEGHTDLTLQAYVQVTTAGVQVEILTIHVL